MKTQKNEIPVFFSCDNRYLPFLAVAIRSLTEHASSDRFYHLYILHTGLDAKLSEHVAKTGKENVVVDYVNVERKIRPIAEDLHIRDYYTTSIYYRIFIPSLFPNLKKAIYLDADIVLTEDVAKLYNIDLGANLLGAVMDAVVAGGYAFRTYASEVVGVPYERYFNSGVLLMNLREMRHFGVERQFVYLLNTYHFHTICPDQDYLNAICSNRVLYLDEGWDKMSLNECYPGTPMLIHYNMFEKPWLYRNVPYERHFWKYAEMTPFYHELLAMREAYREDDRADDKLAAEKLATRALEITGDTVTFKSVLFAEEGRPEYEEEPLYVARPA